MDPLRKQWNQQQQVLRRALGNSGELQTARDLFFAQHVMVHAGSMAGVKCTTFDDQVWLGLPEAAACRLPPQGEHTIAWIIWHIARIEDITMNILVAGSPQLWERDGWGRRMQVDLRDTGNALDADGIARLSADVDLAALREYRNAVGRQTRGIVAALRSEELKCKVEPARLEQVRAQEVVDNASGWLLEYWGGLTIAGLLLMPPTRHNFVHLNEAIRARQKLLKA